MKLAKMVELIDEGSWTVLLEYVANRVSRPVHDYAYFIISY